MDRDLDMASASLMLWQITFMTGVAAVLAMQAASAEWIADVIRGPNPYPTAKRNVPVLSVIGRLPESRIYSDGPDLSLTAKYMYHYQRPTETAE